ncbi:hypothetical protein, partial [Psychrobacter sp. 16-MNA-CIBAN-0192]|uniref:hypothetical protein n=1 Tax=Psychrobacter sp. 16-MNA-CIBAN-0192 TaxID=3140448 RepID=UPI00332D03C7
MYHGPQGLKTIAQRIHRFADILAAGLQAKGVSLKHNTWFDTLTVVSDSKADVIARALASGVNFATNRDGEYSIAVS